VIENDGAGAHLRCEYITGGTAQDTWIRVSAGLFSIVSAAPWTAVASLRKLYFKPLLFRRPFSFSTRRPLIELFLALTGRLPRAFRQDSDSNLLPNTLYMRLAPKFRF